MVAFDNTSLAIANSWLDPQLEAYLGYSLFDDAAPRYRMTTVPAALTTCH
jgi:hypothetical protein